MTFRHRFALLLIMLAALTRGPALESGFTTTPLMQSEVRVLKQMLDYAHFSRGNLKREDYLQLVTDYMALLDPQRLYFTASDEKALRQLYGPSLEEAIAYQGNIDAAFRMHSLFEERVRTRIAWINETLAQGLDLNTEETYTPDRSKEPWPADQAAADDVWRRRLKLELITAELGGKKPEEARQLVTHRLERFLKNNTDLQAPEVQEGFLTAFMQLYDPHSNYFSAITLDDFNIDINLALTGIGALLSLDDEGYCNIVSLTPGGPADLSGHLHPKDRIIAVQQDKAEPVDIVGMRLRDIVRMIRGPKDTKVTLTLAPRDAADQAKTEQVSLIRDVIKLNQARASAHLYDVPNPNGQTAKVGVITLNSFYGEAGHNPGEEPSPSTTKDVAELIKKLQADGATALVIDLRRNGGGLLGEAISLTGLFIDRGPVVQVEDSLGRISLGTDRDPDIAYDGPLALLTSRFSASAAEIFSGALQNYGRAVVIGDTSTFGKGTVQVVYEMENYLPRFANDYGRPGAAKLTTQKYYLPSGASTQQRGVIPDIILPSLDEYIDVGEATEAHAFLWDEIGAAPFQGQPLARDFLAPLTTASKQRQHSLPEFDLLRRNIDWFRTRTEQKILSVNLGIRRTEKETAEATRKKFRDEFKKFSTENFTSKEVLLDAVAAERAKEKEKKPEPAVSQTEAKPDALAETIKPDEATAVAAQDDKGEPKDEDAEEEETPNDEVFDIHLREALRIVNDAARLSADPHWAKQGVYSPKLAAPVVSTTEPAMAK